MRFRHDPPQENLTLPAEVGSVSIADTQTDIPSPHAEEYLGVPAHQRYFLGAPEVQDMLLRSRQLGGIFVRMRGTTIEDMEKKIEESPMDRKTKRLLLSAGFASCAAVSAQTLAQLLAEPNQYPTGDVRARLDVGFKAMSNFKGQLPAFLNEEPIYHDIYQAATNLESQILAYRKNSDSITVRFERDLEGDLPGRFELAKLIARAGINGEAKEAALEEDKAALGWMLKLLDNPYSAGVSLPSVLAGEIESGVFDSLLAREILQDITNPEAAILNMLSLIERTFNTKLEQQNLDRLAGAASLWPKEAMNVLRERREDLLQGMRHTAEKAKMDLAKDMGLTRDTLSSEERFNRSMQKMIDVARGLPRPVIGDAAPQVLRKRMSGPGIRRQAVPRIVQPPIQMEAVRAVNNSLTLVDRDGNVFPQDSERFQDVFEEMRSTYKGTPGLNEDIETVLEYLRRIDFRAPRQRTGLEKLSEGDWRVNIEGELKKSILYRFKINEAVGLSTKTHIIKRHRMLLTVVDSDTVGIIGITPRDKFAQYLKSIGIGTGAR